MNFMNTNMADRFGVRYSQYAIVGTLRASGKPYRRSPTDLQNTLMITSGGVSNLLNRIEDMGYIYRFDDPVDGRGVIVELTDAGFALSEKAMAAQAGISLLVAALSSEDQELLAGSTRRLIIANR